MRTAIIAIFLIGCASNNQEERTVWRTTPITGPDGKHNWSTISCVDSQANCYEASASACLNGYEIADKTDHSHTDTNNRSFVGGNNFWAGGRSSTSTKEHFRQEWLIHCQ